MGVANVITLGWALIVLASWMGWGQTAARLCSQTAAPLAWGLRMAIGAATFICVCGPLIALGCCTAQTLVVLTLAGAAAWLMHVRKQGFAAIAHPNRDWLPYVPVAIILALSLLASTAWPYDWNIADEYPVYMPLIRKLLATGNMIEPFSWRRMASYGGQFVLQAQVLAVRPDDAAFVPEIGLSRIVIFGLVVALLRPQDRMQHLIAAMTSLCVLLFAGPRINSQSLDTGIMMFLALSVLMLEADHGTLVRPWLPIALVGAATATLRANFVPFVLALIPVSAAVRYLVHRGRAFPLTRHAAQTMAFTLLLLIPWAVALYQSNRTPLFPLVYGNYTEVGMLKGEETIVQQVASYFTGFVLGPAIVVFTGALFLWRRENRVVAVPLYVLGAGVALMQRIAFPDSDMDNLYRYSVPFLVPAFVVAVCLPLAQSQVGWIRPACLLAISACLWLEPGHALRSRNHLARLTRSIRGADKLPSILRNPDYRLAHQALQDMTPPQARIMVITNYPAFMDYHRNDIQVLDLPGCSSPPPGLPLASGCSAMRQYFLDLGFDYIIADDFRAPLGFFSRQLQTNFAQMEHTEKPGPEHVHVLNYRQAPRILKAMEEVDKLAAETKNVRACDPLRLIPLPESR